MQSFVELGQKQAASILNSLDAIVYVADMQSHEILYLNEYTEKIFGNIVGQICWQKLQANQNGPCPFCSNDRLLRADGQPEETLVWEFQNTIDKRWYDVRDKAIEWSDGRHVRLEIATDITLRKEAEAALAEARNELEKRVAERGAELKKAYEQLLHAEKLSAIGSLSASIAHEFNNPLYGVLSVLDGIKESMELGEEQQEMVDMALGEGQRMKKLIQGLQDFNRPSSGGVAPVNIHEAIETMLLLTRKEFSARKISIKKELAAEPPMVTAADDQVKQVLLNLLQNAATAMPNGGQLTIATHLQGEMMEIVVQDNGVGIAKEHLKRIFEPFFSTKTMTKGTGLGLAVSHGIVKRHGGTIAVASEPGKGSTFTVVIPVTGGAYEKSENHPAC